MSNVKMKRRSKRRSKKRLKRRLKKIQEQYKLLVAEGQLTLFTFPNHTLLAAAWFAVVRMGIAGKEVYEVELPRTEYRHEKYRHAIQVLYYLDHDVSEHVMPSRVFIVHALKELGISIHELVVAAGLGSLYERMVCAQVAKVQEYERARTAQ